MNTDFGSLMEQKLKREKAHRNKRHRRSQSKTRPLGDGKAADVFQVWESFDQEVDMFWSEYGPKLAEVKCKKYYPCRGITCGVITEETDTRHCFFSCIAEPVSAAAREGLHENMVIASAASVGVSNADVGGFITRPRIEVQEEYLHSSDESFNEESTETYIYDFDLDDEVIPIEVKPDWQVHLRRTKNIVHMMASDDEKVKVRSALSQIFLYMVLEESQYGILTTKDRSVFLRYSVDEPLKRLEASRTICYDDPIGVRKCFLFMVMKAKLADRCPLSQTWTTPEGEKWIPPRRNKRQSPLSRNKMKQLASTRKASRTSNVGRGRIRRQSSREMEVEGAAEREATQEKDCVSLSADFYPWEMETMGSVGSGAMDSAAGALVVDEVEEEWVIWAKSLKKLDIGDLHLGHIIKKGGGHKVWKGTMQGHEVAIKMFDFCENLQDLQCFFNEVQMYVTLAHLQGKCIPYLIDYGLTWGGFLGYLAMSREGSEVDCEELSTREKRRLFSAVRQIHKSGIVHGDLRSSNLLHGGRIISSFVLVDFEHSKLASSSKEVDEEMKNIQALLKV